MSEDQIDAQRNTLTNAALALLARREYSRGELQERLVRKSSRLDLIEEILDTLEEQGLQSDERFSEHFVRYRIDQGKGPHCIRRDLRQKSISDTLISQHVPDDPDFWVEKATQVYARKFKQNPLNDEKDKAKRLRFMVSRGFSAHQVYPLMD